MLPYERKHELTRQAEAAEHQALFKTRVIGHSCHSHTLLPMLSHRLKCTITCTAPDRAVQGPLCSIVTKPRLMPATSCVQKRGCGKASQSMLRRVKRWPAEY